MADITAWHGRTLADHIALRDDAAKKGYRFLSLSIYGSTAAPVFAAVMIKRPVIVAQHDWPSLTADQFQQTFEAQAKLGYGPVIIAATGSASDPRFAVVFQPMNPIPLTRHLLGSGAASDSNDERTPVYHARGIAAFCRRQDIDAGKLCAGGGSDGAGPARGLVVF